LNAGNAALILTNRDRSDEGGLTPGGWQGICARLNRGRNCGSAEQANPAQRRILFLDAMGTPIAQKYVFRMRYILVKVTDPLDLKPQSRRLAHSTTVPRPAHLRSGGARGGPGWRLLGGATVPRGAAGKWCRSDGPAGSAHPSAGRLPSSVSTSIFVMDRDAGTKAMTLGPAPPINAMAR